MSWMTFWIPLTLLPSQLLHHHNHNNNLLILLIQLIQP
jgi:hypothetical protein